MAVIEPNLYRARNRQSRAIASPPVIGVMGRLLVLMVFAVILVRIAAMVFHLT